jgi:phage I-like protein
VEQATLLSVLNIEADKTSDWIELIPAPNANGMVQGRDGRAWYWDRQAADLVLSAFNSRGIDIVVDWEHATETRAPNGDQAPASGWISQIELRDSALFGKVSWTPRAAEQIASREYRFLSPVFDYNKETQRIARLVSVGLTNKPNLYIAALNNEALALAARSTITDTERAIVQRTGIDEADYLKAKRADIAAVALNNESLALAASSTITDTERAIVQRTGIGEADYLKAKKQEKENG